MPEYIVSARKYRPDSFETLIGQDNIARTLKNSILRGKLAHAYLFCGPRGVGKTTTARIFAKAINCSNPSAEMEPCGECESCRSFQEGRSYCIHELDAASNNGVDDIKNLMDQVQIPPQVGKYSVYIIDEVHMLSTAAFNAFLKTLEEPPAHAIFILATTEKHKILPTILSRCQTYDFNRISVPDIVSNLKGIAEKEGVSIDDESLHVIARKADGAMRDALTIFDQTVAFCGTKVEYAEVLKNLNVLDYDYSFSLVDDLPGSLKERYSEQASRCSLRFLYEALGITTACEAGYKQAVNPRLHIEFALMKLSFLLKSFQAEPAAAPSRPARPKARETQPVSPGAPSSPAVPAPAASSPAEPAAEPPQGAAPSTAPAPGESPSGTDDPAPKPRPRPRPAKTGAALSLNSIVKEGAGKSEDSQEPEKTTQLPDDEVVLSAWKTIPAGVSSSPRLASALSSAKVKVSVEGGVKVLTFTVSNESQEKWIRANKLLALEGILQKNTGSSNVRLEIEVAPVEDKSTQPYTDQEKATVLMDKSSEVKNLVRDFGLETE